MKKAREEKSPAEIEAISGIICKNAVNFLQRQLKGQSSCSILLYYPLGREISLNGLFEQLKNSAADFPCELRIYYPRVRGDEMDFYRVESLSDLSEGTFHVMEPSEDEGRRLVLSKEDAAVCFVPGLCFSRNGARCGYGKGYYDKYLSANPGIVKVGICGEFQLADEIITDEFDVKMDFIITEKE